MAKTAAQIIADAIVVIKQKQPLIDLSEGTLARDIGVEAFATELSNLYTDLDDTKDILFLANAADISTTDMDALAANYELTRLPAIQAIGSVVFGALSLPVGTITIGAGDGTGGITILTQPDTDGTQVSFVTTETVYLTPTTPINSLTGLYEVTAAIRAVTAGVIGNVGADTITQLSGAISGIDSVTNPIATTNGADIEDNTDLAARIILKFSGIVLGSKNAYNTLVRAISGVTDSLVVDPTSADTLRGAGSIDIYLIGSTATSASQSVVRAAETEVILTNQPVTSISAITGTAGGIATVFRENIDYVFIPDTTTVEAASINAVDKIVWTGVIVPDLGTTYIITYLYNKLIADVQDVVDLDENHVLGADVLIKQATEVLVDIAVSVSLLPGYTSGTALATTTSAITTAITAFADTSVLGASLRQSDLIADIEAVTGVDYVAVPLTTFARRGSTGAADIVATSKEYFRVDNASITVTII